MEPATPTMPELEITPEPEQATVPVQPPAAEPPPTVQPPVTESVVPTNPKVKKPPKLLYLVVGVAVILISVALAIVFYGNKSSDAPGSTTTTNTNGDSTTKELVPGWPTYSNKSFFYEIAIPPKWVEIRHSPLHPELSLFNAVDNATLEIKAQKDLSTLEEFIANQDQTYSGLVKAKSSTQVKVGEYDGIERDESWPTVGLQGVTTYIKISDMFYTFTLTPGGGKNSIPNEAILRDYHTALSSFHLTDTTQLGLDLKEYQSEQVEGLSFKPFSLKYPQTWVVKEEFVGSDTLTVSIYRNNYEIKITQAPVGGAVCLFKDSPDFQGSSGDLRGKEYTEFDTGSGVTMRRYFNANEGAKSSLFFCDKESNSPYFSTPTDIGGIAYYVPAKYDLDIVKEMDEIVKSIVPVESNPSPSPSPSLSPSPTADET